MQPAVDTQREVLAHFAEMYEATLPVVFGFLMVRVGGNRSLAEDLTAETYSAAVKLYKSGRADEPRPPSSGFGGSDLRRARVR